MPIENRVLEPGTRLVARYKKKEYSATVVQTDKGLRYRLEDGREFKSPSAAGTAVMGGVACNGWRFWSIAGSEQAKSKAPKAAKKAPERKAKPNGGNDLITRLDDGRFFCSGCQDAFSVPEGVEPQGCPQGHTQQQDEPAPAAKA
jgi:hypothetical protein